MNPVSGTRMFSVLMSPRIVTSTKLVFYTSFFIKMVVYLSNLFPFSQLGENFV